ncbi:putative glycoprotein [Wenling crustacean virus 15]|uniref:Putative glycoprotein n=1 Tax=Wenling crustacean virus 15 TaxID=1923484 RepID=A0A1L3KN53_9VIRU|nr:putative glycoprotein [Wenling crustacean virus 15]APG78841.1 putative glycoprotein [Wenling crustacean virus 15]
MWYGLCVISSLFLYLTLDPSPFATGMPVAPSVDLTAQPWEGVGIQAYDCSKPKHVATHSTVDVGSCAGVSLLSDNPSDEVTIVQIPRQTEVPGYLCRIRAYLSVDYCGYSAQTSLVRERHRVSISPSNCLRLVQGRTVQVSEYGREFDLTGAVGELTQGSADIAGGRGDPKYPGCSRGYIWYGGKALKYHVAWIDWELEIIKVVAQHNPSTSLATVGGVEYAVAGQQDTLAGTWVPLREPPSLCEVVRPVWTGSGRNVTTEDRSVLVFSTPRFQVGLEVGTDRELCGRPVKTTQLGNIVIASPSAFLGNRTADSLGDVLTHIAVQASYTYYVGKADALTLASRVRNATCSLERNIIQLQLLAAVQTSAVLSLDEAETRGLLATDAGEAYHLWRCEATRVHVRDSTRCYKAIPVSYNGTDRFVLPRSRRLVSEAELVPCSDMAPFLFKESGRWYSLSPEVQRHPTPALARPTLYDLIHAEMGPTWREEGIYTEDQYGQLTEHLEFPHTRNAFVAEYASGESRFLRAATEWTPLGISGWAGIILRLLCNWWWVVVLVGLLTTIVLNGRRLHHHYGPSWKLLAAPHDGATQYLVHPWGDRVRAESAAAVSCPESDVPLVPMATIRRPYGGN